MRVLLLGGTGVLGRAIAIEALKRGHELVTLADHSGIFPPPAGVVRHLTVDREDDGAMRAAFAGWAENVTWDLVVDAICYSVKQAAILNSLITGRTKRLVVITSSIVYSAHQLQPIEENGRLEAPEAFGEYGAAKLAIEEFWLGRYPESDIAPTVVRLPHVLGCGAELGAVPLHNRDAFLVSRLRQGKSLLLVDGGRQLLQVVFSEDVASAVFDVASAPRTLGELYNCCNPDIVTAHAYYSEIARLLGTNLKVVGIEYEAIAKSSWGWLPTAHSRILSVNKMREHAGVSCRTPLAVALERTLRPLLQRECALDPLQNQLENIERLAATGREDLAAALSHASHLRSRTAVDRRMNG
ncbi:MAG TPA: NAD-dependent epimerase/dehydratase family protein [Thermoanaerobaculia bacterium]